MKQSILGVHKPFYKLCLVAADTGLVALSFYIASVIRLGVVPNFLSIEYLTLNTIIIVCLFLGNGYTGKLLGSTPRLPLSTFFVALSSAIPCAFFIYLMGPERFTSLFGRGIFPAAILLTGIFTVVGRVLLNKLFDEKRAVKNILVLCDNASSNLIAQFFGDKFNKLNFTHSDAITDKFIKSNYEVIVISPEYKASDSEQRLLLSSRLSGTPIFSLSDFFESYLFLIPVNGVNNDWFIRSEGFTMLHSTVTIRLKRAIDIVLSSTLLLLSLPIVIVCALIIKITSRGPAIFSQTRVGVEGKEFTIYKLRTMHYNAEKDGAKWASDNDARIFWFGKFLRASRIDELPQCWNILKGEMSFVGPRPERPEFTSMLASEIPYYDLRHIVKPGLTGWAQVNYPYGASIEDALRKLQFDLYYIKNYSLLLDLNILLRTIRVTLMRTGR